MSICNILGVPFNNIKPNEAVDKMMSLIDSKGKSMVFTPNPEMVMKARKDREFMEVLNSSAMNVPDGIGIVYASKFTKNPIKERVAGYDMLLSVFDRLKDTDKTVYFFGSAPGIAQRAKAAIEQRYPGIKIAGCADGYFDDEKEKKIIESKLLQKR